MASRSNGMLLAYRIGSSTHPLFDGARAASSGEARWNSRGRFVIYAAEHYATAVLEKIAQLNAAKIPRTLSFIRIHIPGEAPIEEIRPEELPGWDSDDKTASQSFGDEWYDSRRSLVLLVPSLAAAGLERNLLINQRHVQVPQIAVDQAEPIRVHPKLLVPAKSRV